MPPVPSGIKLYDVPRVRRVLCLYGSTLLFGVGGEFECGSVTRVPEGVWSAHSKSRALSNSDWMAIHWRREVGANIAVYCHATLVQPRLEPPDSPLDLPRAPSLQPSAVAVVLTVAPLSLLDVILTRAAGVPRAVAPVRALASVWLPTRSEVR